MLLYPYSLYCDVGDSTGKGFGRRMNDDVMNDMNVDLYLDSACENVRGCSDLL
jgi:hypothetical protein